MSKSEVKRIEKCNKCGNENFAVARNMIGTRICKCGNTWAPGEAQGEFCKHGTHESHYCGSCNKESYDSIKKENEELKARVGKLRKALQKYADPETHSKDKDGFIWHGAYFDYETAIEALKEDGNG